MYIVMSEDKLPSLSAMAARAKSLELNNEQTVAPEEDPLELHTVGFAKTLSSAVFITGLNPDVAAECVGYFTGPYQERKKVGKPIIDFVRKEVRISVPNGRTVTARYFGSQGCITLPPGQDDVFFKPVEVKPNLPDASKTKWPMGDILSDEPLPKEIDGEKLKKAIDAAFEPMEAYTEAFVVTYKNRLIGERYMRSKFPPSDKTQTDKSPNEIASENLDEAINSVNINHSTPLESWSMGKSVTGTLMGVLMQKGIYNLHQNAPIPEWNSVGDLRKEIRISDLMNMSSGLRCRSPFSPDDPIEPYMEHLYLYTGCKNTFKYAASLPLQWPPGKIGRYRNCDPVLVNYLIRLGVENLGESYHLFPQRNLFDKIGIRSMVMETDPYGNFMTHGYEYMSARDWARLGNLYLQDGVWAGERILPEGFVKFVSTVAPAWAADNNPIYGGFFWLNGLGEYPVPTDAFYMLGAGGQYVWIIPSHHLVVVRLGFFKGELFQQGSIQKSLAILMDAVKPQN